jgi:hypothetical protein
LFKNIFIIGFGAMGTVLAVVCLFVIGCGRTQAPDGQPAAKPSCPYCDRLSAEQIRTRIKGMTFESEELREVGLGPNGIEAMGHWGLSFMKTRPVFKWLHSDMEEADYYSVSEDGRIIASYRGEAIEMPHDSNLTRIQWQGMWYKLMRDSGGDGQQSAPADAH